MTLPPWRSHWDRGPHFALVLPVAAAGISSQRFLLYLRQSVSLDRETKIKIIRKVYGRELTHRRLLALISSLYLESIQLHGLARSGQLDRATSKRIERRLFRAWCDWFEVVSATPELPWTERSETADPS